MTCRRCETPLTEANTYPGTRGHICRRCDNARRTESRHRNAPVAREAIWRARHADRARRAGVDYERVTRTEIWERSQGRCGICGEGILYAEMTVDHIVPISKGGQHRLDNLQAAHRGCNSRKGARQYEPDVIAVMFTDMQSATRIIRAVRAAAQKDGTA
jgi:5-methylcytosine-specific restriction endonuclease McrA